METLNTRSDAVIPTNNITTSTSVMAASQSNNQNENNKLSPKLSISGINNETFDGIALNLNNLAYRAEGNANLVLSIIERRKIVRVRKSDKKCFYNKDQSKDDEFIELQLCSNYIKLFMTLLSQEFTTQPQLIEIQINDYDAFNSWLIPQRPAERLDKEVRCRYGILYPDVAYLPDVLLLNENVKQDCRLRDTFCLELKPKQGWTFFNCNQDTLSLIDFTRIDKCRYCCMQYLKMQTDVIQQPSEYCPIDLFSGSRQRMRYALNGLIKSPQNNFRLFKNGQLIFNKKTESISINEIVKDIFKNKSACLMEFVDLIINILTKEFSNTVTHDEYLAFETNTQNQRCIEPTINYLPAMCILKQILDIQLLSKSNICSNNEFEENNSPFMYINSLLKKTCAEISNSCSGIQNFLEKLTKKERYLLGATALDCSLMLTFQCISNIDIDSQNINTTSHIVTIGLYKFLVNISVVDADPKSMTHFEKYVKQTNNSHEAYRRYLVNAKNNGEAVNNSK